jgi:hypothetical protein
VRRKADRPEEVDFPLRELRAEPLDPPRVPALLPDLDDPAPEALRDRADEFFLVRKEPPVAGL